ncbi:MAG: hypothetical protein AAFO07_15980 [Bacteroidota bacterium]
MEKQPNMKVKVSYLLFVSAIMLVVVGFFLKTRDFEFYYLFYIIGVFEFAMALVFLRRERSGDE